MTIVTQCDCSGEISGKFTLCISRLSFQTGVTNMFIIQLTWVNLDNLLTWVGLHRIQECSVAGRGNKDSVRHPASKWELSLKE